MSILVSGAQSVTGGRRWTAEVGCISLYLYVTYVRIVKSSVLN